MKWFLKNNLYFGRAFNYKITRTLSLVSKPNIRLYTFVGLDKSQHFENQFPIHKLFTEFGLKESLRDVICNFFSSKAKQLSSLAQQPGLTHDCHF